VNHTHIYDLPCRPSQTHNHQAGQPHSLAHSPDVISIPAHELASQTLLPLSLFLGALSTQLLRPLPAEQFIGLVDGALLPANGVFLPAPEQPPRL
jgi:hypothetical protein